MDKVKIGLPIEYECDGIIYDGLFLREPEIKELEKRLKEINKITDLKQQCKKQKEVIDKAIEYIKSYKTDYSPYELSDYNVRQILEILNEVSE